MQQVIPSAAAQPFARGVDIAMSARRLQLGVGVLAALSVGLAPGQSEIPSTDAPAWFVDRAVGYGIEFQPRYGTPERRWITESGGSGAAWIDYDVDGRLDAFFPDALDEHADRPDQAAERVSLAARNRSGSSRPGHRLFRREGAGFKSRGLVAGVAGLDWGNGAAVADYDNDGWPDLYITAIGSNRLLRNNGDGTFSAIREAAADDGWSSTAVFTDWDNDGFVDLYVTNYLAFDAAQVASPCRFHLRGIEVFCGPHGLPGQRDALYRNLGDGRFDRWPDATVDADATFGLAALATDCDSDGRPEIYVATDSTINLLYRRNDDGLPDDWSFLSGAGLSASGAPQAGMGVSAGDFDGDGHLDLAVTNFQHDRNNLFRSVGACAYEDVADAVGFALPSLPYMGWGVLFLDVDGDADLDVFVANGHIYPQVETPGADPGDRGELFDVRNDPEGRETYAQRNLLFINRLRESGVARLEEIGTAAGPGMALLAVSRGAILGDFDNDGDADLVVTHLDRGPSLLVNEGTMSSPWLRLSLIGRTSNRGGYGARVRVTSGGIDQVTEIRHSDGYLGSNDTRALVFLPGGRADVVEVRWPSGASTRLANVDPGWLLVDEVRGVIASR